MTFLSSSEDSSLTSSALASSFLSSASSSFSSFFSPLIIAFKLSFNVFKVCWEYVFLVSKRRDSFSSMNWSTISKSNLTFLAISSWLSFPDLKCLMIFIQTSFTFTLYTKLFVSSNLRISLTVLISILVFLAIALSSHNLLLGHSLRHPITSTASSNSKISGYKF